MKLYEIFTLLNEDRSEWVKQNLGKKIEAAVEAEVRNGTHRGETDLDFVIGELKKADPEDGKNIVWLARQYAEGQFKLEDISGLRLSLELFRKNLRNIQKKDLNAYKNLGEFYDAVEPFRDGKEAALSAKELAKQTKLKGAEKIVDKPNFKVISPKTEEAACLYGAGTTWCTAATKSENRFEHYHAKGPLYIIMTKIGGKDRKWQFHVENNEYKQENDQDISKSDIAALSKMPEYTEFLNMLIKKHYGKYLDD